MTQQNAWYRKKRQELIKRFGGSCWLCPISNGSYLVLEFAHVKPTELSGGSRGSNHRVVDVLRNKDCYALLCQKCHKEFDKLRGDELRYEEQFKVLEVIRAKQIELELIQKFIWFGFPEKTVRNKAITKKIIKDFILGITGNCFIKESEECFK